MKRKVNKTLFLLLLILTNIALCTHFYLKTYLGDVTFFQVYFHLFNSSASGGTFTVIIGALWHCLPLIIGLILIEVFVFTRWKKYRVYVKSNKTKKEYDIFPTIFSKYRITFSFIALIISIFILFDYLNFIDYLDTINSTTDIYEKYYVDTNKVNISFKGKKRNLIYIYLESMESSLFSKDNNGAFEESRIPELEKLAKKNINFSQNNGLGGMYDIDGYTISALVSSTSSTPIAANCHNECYKQGDLVPNVRTLGDVLTKEGYNIEIMQGSDATFAGYNKYISQHGNQKMFDYNEAVKRKYIDKDYFVWWGYEDKKLFEYAKKEITDLSKQKEPFAVSVITIDTHFPDGFVDEKCEKKFDDQMSNAFSCSSKKVNDFVSWIKKQSFYDDTMIVITGDHKSMQRIYFDKATDEERKVYNVFINSKKDNVNSKNRVITNFDIYPTVLSGLGADIKGNRIGFGTNLFSNEKTIPEIIGFDTFKQEKAKPSNYYDKYINSKTLK